MKQILILCLTAAALQVSYAEQDNIKTTLDQVEHKLEEIGEMFKKSVNPDEMKEEVVKFQKTFETAMQQVNDNVQNYIKDHPDSPVAQMKAKMDEAVAKFKEQNPDVEGNVQKAQQELTQWGEKFAQQTKAAYEKMNEEGGVKDQLSKVLGDIFNTMKESAGQFETKLKEMVH